MLYRKKGYPEEGDIVLCTVTNIQGNSIFASMDEYSNLSGMIHISEVSPGRIRNIRDFVREGKVIYCKVLKTYLDKGHFDLSLRRVGEGIKREKAAEMKQELKAEKIVEMAAKKLKQPVEIIYNSIADKILKKYEYLHLCFEKVSKGEEKLGSLGIENNIDSELTELIKQRVKPKEIIMGGKFTIKVFSSEGIDVIKDAFNEIEGEKSEVKYLGAGNYNIRIKGDDPKETEKILNEKVEKIIEFIESKKGSASFKREEIKAEAE